MLRERERINRVGGKGEDDRVIDSGRKGARKRAESGWGRKQLGENG